MTQQNSKWHLGFMKWDYTPTFRGFDSFLGYYGPAMYYYEHFGYESSTTEPAFDLHWNTDDYDQPRRFSLDIWSEHAEYVIADQASKFNTSQTPFFFYLAWQGSHVPSESAEEYYELYAHNLTAEEKESNSDRLNFQAQTTHTDAMFQKVCIFSALLLA